MPSKVVLLTGATSGIGLATAMELARQGAELTIVGHTAERAARARAEIVRRSGNDDVRALAADLLSLRGTRGLAGTYAASHPRLDVLINNAGSNFPTFDRTEDGIERTMALNYFSPFLLTRLLLPSLRSAAPSRVVNVASVAHFSGRIAFQDLKGNPEMGTGGLAAYARSKLALVLFTYELARREAPNRVTANCLHPGAVRTHIWAHAGRYTPLTRFAALFMRSPVRGARTPVYLALDREVEGVTGKYFVDSRAVPSSRPSQDPELARRLWELSVGITDSP